MKKTLLSIAISILSLSAVAQSYRGMIDIYAGTINASKEAMTAPNAHFESKPFMGGLFTTSHGAQITPFLFIGAGGGVCLGWNELSCVDPVTTNGYNDLYAVTVPAFLDFRWDLDVRKKVTPFVDIKVGYQFKVGENNYLDVPFEVPGYEYPVGHSRYSVGTENSVFFQPSAGVRFKGGKHTGFNLGISYNTTLKRNLYIYDPSLDKDEILDSATDGILMLNIGLDF